MNNAGTNLDLCWIASYPRSGNTFLRIVMSNVLFGIWQEQNLNQDVPEYVSPNLLQVDGARRVTTSTGEVIFAKTHHHEPPAVTGFRNVHGMYIYRHPLDVFLSGLNFIYLNSDTVSDYAGYFIGKIPKPVDQIFSDGEMEHYLDRFIEDDGIAPFSPFSGRWSESLIAWHAAAKANGAIHCLDYAELVSDTEQVIEGLLIRLGVTADPELIGKGIARARLRTKSDGKFYWKARPGTFREFLSTEQLDRYFTRYGPLWADLGIAFAR